MSESYQKTLKRVNNNKNSWASLKVSKQKYSAKIRGVDWKLNDFVIKKKIAESTTCALSGRRLMHEIDHPDAPSIDRKNSLGDYTTRNSQIVCTVINTMKGEMSVSEFVQRCREVVAHADSLSKV
jgi:hypothetical protein